MEKLEMIDVEKIYAHPNNPRKELGDLTELRDSIKQNGIFQNLTVVPKEKDTYTVIIGHRRLAAAKQAGVLKVPCAIVEMDEKTQVGTMLLENMQRSDLTLIEQAEGFQMMLDFGDSVEVVAEKTGFSESTVRRRVKMLALNKKKLQAAEQRGGTLEDYIKAAEIKNAKERDKVTDAIGTSNFSWTLRNALEKQELDEKMPAIKKEMKEIGATRDDGIYSYSGKYDEAVAVDISDYKEGCIKKKTKKNTEYWWNVNYNRIHLFKKKPKQEPAKKSAKELKAIDLRKKLKIVSVKAYELRKEFASNFTAGKKYAEIFNEWMWELQYMKLTGRGNSVSWELLCEKIGEDYTKYKYSCNREKLESYVKENPANAPVVILMALTGDSKEENYFFEGYGESLPTHKKNSTLDVAYKYLCKLGYEMSDEEKALQNGTHELFAVKE